MILLIEEYRVCCPVVTIMEGRLVYSTKLKSSTRRYVAKCIVNRNGPSVVDFVVDTGAKYTCCSSMSIGVKLSKEQLTGIESKLLGGMISGSTLRVYKYHVQQFSVGTVDMGEQDIWITFDPRATDDVLGMDILRNSFFLQDADKEELYFSRSLDELKNMKCM